MVQRPRGECMSMQLTIFEHSKTEKKCCSCKELKSFVNFSKDKRAKDKLQSYCNLCRKVYAENNKEIIQQKRKVYYQKNKELIIKGVQVWQENNKDYYLQQQKTYIKKRLKSDPLFRLIQNLRARNRQFCKSVELQKNWRTIDAMGCTREEFIAYFQTLFTEGMTWQNYGAWHVDHIKPISLATTEQEAIELSHYTNLQPLWAEDNIRKSNKYD